ncbi:MAG: hypothetical protein QNJ60_04360 [Xenococcaceae cyanobacterium MO_188.B19]|nr:hypothetical protein [Xenococcaceae cyanobacterium MO_188.B19]
MINNLLIKFKKVTVLLVLINTIILIPSFLLLMASSWSNDDYGLAKLFQVFGLQGLSWRVLYGSPRFLSETVLYIYYHLVSLFKQPFTGFFVFTLWLGLILSLFISSKNIVYKFSEILINSQTLQKNELFKIKISKDSKFLKLDFLVPLLLSLIIFCYFIYVEKPVTMYYAPAVAAPYLLTLSGIILSINFLLTKADNSQFSWLEFVSFTLISLMVSASWEIGAVYQLVLNTCLLSIFLLTTFKPRLKYVPFGAINVFSKIKLFIGILISSALSLYVIVLIKTYRVGSVEVNSSFESALTGNWKNSFIASLARFIKEILFLNSNALEITNYWHSFLYATFCKLGLLLVFLLIFFRIKIKISQRVKTACLIFIIPLLITNFITIITSYYQFGIICCPRQLSFRGALFGLVIFILSLLFSSKINDLFGNNIKTINKNNISLLFSKTLSWNFTLIITFSLTITLLVNLQVNHLKLDIVNIKRIINTNNINWQKSLDKNNSFAIHRQIPTSYIYRFNLKEGIYPSCSSQANILAILYMNYFDKEEFYVLPVEENITSLRNKYPEKDRYLTSSNNPDNIRFICRYSRGSVDRINDVTRTSSVITISKNKPVEIQGWAVKPDRTKAYEVIITMGNDNQIVARASVNQSNLGVAEFFKNPDLINSGWIANFIVPFKEQEDIVTFKVWTYDAEKKSAYLFREFSLQFVE